MKYFIFTFSLLLSTLAVSAQNIDIHGDFEAWHNFTVSGTSLEAPQGWGGFDSLADALSLFLGTTQQKQVFSTTDRHGGNSAVRLITANYGGQLDTASGMIVNGRPGVNLMTKAVTYTNLTPINERVRSMTIWTKYFPASSIDSPLIGIQVFKTGAGAGGADSMVGYGQIYSVPAGTTYSMSTIPLKYRDSSTVPDKVLIFISSSGGANNLPPGVPGSELYADDVVLNLPSGISQPVFGQPNVWCFPNPAKDIINFETSSTVPLTWQIYAMDGRIVDQQTFTGKGTCVMKGKPAGLYLYRINSTSGVLTKSGSFRVE